MILKIDSRFSLNFNNKPPKNVDNKCLNKQINYQPSFKGVNQAEILNKLKQIENLHCPICGVSLLSEKNFLEITRTKCQTVEEIAKLLRKNKKYIQPNLRNLVSDFEDLSNENPNMSAAESISKIRELSIRKRGFWLQGLQKDVINTAGIEKDLAKKINTIIENFRKYSIDYNQCKNEFYKIIEDMNTPEYNNLYKKIIKLLKEIYMTSFVLSVKNVNEMSDKDKVETFISKVFINSKIKENHLQNKIDADKGVGFLECTSCHSSKKIQHVVREKDESVEKNFLQYFKDIFESGFYDSNFSQYIINFINLIRFATKFKINTIFAKSERFKEIKTEIVKLESPATKFKLANISGIPCACCGVITLTHKEKEDLSFEIKKTKNLYELRNLIQGKSIHIHPPYRVILDRFNKLLDENPNISDSEIINNLRLQTKTNIINNIKDSINIAQSFIENNDLPNNDKELLNKFINYAKNEFIDFKPLYFPVKRFYEIFDETIAKLESPKEKSKFYPLKENLFNEFKRQFVVNPPHKINATNKSDLKDTFAYLFTRASSTVDHIHAKSKEGENEINNYMILCKDCNQAKKDRDVDSWIKKNESINIISNLQNYLNIVNEKIKNLNLKKLKNYPINFVKQIRKETNYSVSLKLPKDNNKI